MKFTFLFSMAMVAHITAQMEAPAPAPSAFMAPSPVVATGPAPAPTPFDAPAPAPAPMQALANTTNMTNTPAPAWPDPPLVWPSTNETSAVGNDTANATTPAPAPAPATVNVNMALTVEDPAGFVADPNAQGAVETGIAATIEGVEAADVNATLTVRTGRRLSGDNASGIVDVAAVITADDAAAATDIQSRIQQGNAALLITTAINEAAFAAGMNVTVEVTSLTASQPPASGGATTSPPAGESGAFKPAVVSKMVVGLVALFFAF